MDGHDTCHLSGHDSHHELLFSAQQVEPLFSNRNTHKVAKLHNRQCLEGIYDMLYNALWSLLLATFTVIL